MPGDSRRTPMRQRDPCGIKGLHTPIVSSFLLKSYHLSERKPSKTCGSLEYFPSGDVHGRECLGLLAGSNARKRQNSEGDLASAFSLDVQPLHKRAIICYDLLSDGVRVP